MTPNWSLSEQFVQIGPGGPPVLMYTLTLYAINPDGSATTYASLTANADDTIDNLINNVINAEE